MAAVLPENRKTSRKKGPPRGPFSIFRGGQLVTDPGGGAPGAAVAGWLADGDGVAGATDGPAAQARFNGPLGVAVDGAGNVFVADTYNDRIRRIGRDGKVTTLAGGERPGYQDGAAAAALFDTPTAVAVDALGNVWIADLRNHAIRKLATDGVVSTLLSVAPGDGNAALRRPLGIAVTGDGMLYVSSLDCGCVSQVTRNGHLHVLTGVTRDTRLSRPAGLALDAAGVLHVADASSYRVYRVAPLPAATAVPASPTPSPGLATPQTPWPAA